ncbi:ubiquinone biosynthesis protein [Loktanella sp. DSM 29012]|uniref:2-polyprenylphenol 6-hydroxylase n=1 Tax=Loktanella gaetbuli TaxID=2881335 RepID=A0ABS8BUH3_9RHOB|nr:MULTISPECIES: 2-polyprenylphenol 6-hydroxylase [Loktanella]MCB5199360.1 2-polyprenylphenol 6-hydroxylase [Loktanella gaetbuli]SEP56841.1 ubiquinone biosynthesis protein [Loktanella sp. DSM 29012]
MRGPHNIIRLIRTGATLERTGAMRVIMDAFEVGPLLRGVVRGVVWPFKWLGYKGDVTMPPAPRALTALGPAYIKFGQVLSTRPDVVGNEMATQLRVLQDKLPPFSLAEARAEVRRELGVEVEDVFSSFSDPVAAASLAQVHKATLAATGEDVAVKILRPGIERAFRRDIDAFYFAARFVEVLSPASRRLKPMDVITHFEGVVMGELDLRLESSAAAEFAANTENDAGFHVPRIRWDLSGRRVMTLDWAEGIGAGDIDALDAAGLDRKAIADRVLTLFLNHALRDGFFHGDMHQGNLKIRADGTIIAYDFGIMGRIDSYTRRVYAEILFGFIRQDYQRVAEVHFEAGYVPADKDVDEFARALRAVGEPIFGMDASRISMARLLSYLFEVTERFGMETRTELILLQRTMVVVEGVARTLDPNMNIWQSAKPVVTDYVSKSIGPRALLDDLRRTAIILARFGPQLPRLAEEALIRLNNPPPPPRPQRRIARISWAALGATIVGLLWLAESIL